MTEPRSKKRAGWLRAVALLLSAFIMFFALLPTILSSQPGKRWVLGVAAPHIPGAVQVDTWSLSWFRSQRIGGLVYTDQGAGLQVAAPEITVAKGLASFLVDRSDLASVTITRPDIQISLPDPVSQENPGKQFPPEASPDGTTDSTGQEDQPPPTQEPLPLPLISGSLLVQEGTVTVFRPEKGAEAVADDINLKVDIDSLADDITYSFSMASPEGDGTISGNGSVVLQGTETAVGSIRPTGNLKIRNWDLTQILELVAASGATPAGSGTLDGTIFFDGSLNEGITLEGSIDLADLELSGGPLGDDRPSIKKTSVAFTSLIGLNILEFLSLELTSPLVTGTLSASVAAYGPLKFGADLQVNIKEVAGQIPRTLNLQEGLQLTGGLLAITGQLQSDEGINRFSGDALIEGLAGIRDGQQISLAKPFTLSLKGQQGKGSLSLENFTVQSSFLECDGQGDLNDLRLSLKADLGAALAEISKFFSLRDYAAEGRFTASLEAQRADETTVSLKAQLGANDLLVRQGETVIIPRKPLKLATAADLMLSSDFTFTGIAKGTLNYEAWLGRGSLKVKDVFLTPDQGIQSIGKLAGDNQLNLGDLSIMLTSLGALSTTLALNGESRVLLNVSGENGRFLIDNVVVDSPIISIQKDGAQLVPASTLTVKGSSEVVLGSEGSLTTIDKPQFSYQSWVGSGAIQASSIDIATTKVKELEFTGTTHLAKLADVLTALELLQAGMTFGGSSSSSLKMDYSPEKIDLASLKTEIKDFVFTQEGKTYRDTKVAIETLGTVDTVQRAASFSPLHIDSANGAISLEQLAVGDWSNAANTLDSTGQARFSLPTILNAVADWYSLPPGMSTTATVNVNWIAKGQKEANHSYRVTADLDGFSLTKNEQQVLTGEKIGVQAGALRNPTSGNVELNQLNIASSLLNFNATGFWNPTAESGSEFGLNGNLDMDLARIAALVRIFTEIDLEMAGTSARPFELRGNVPPEQARQWWRHTDFKGSFQADFLEVLGVELKALEIPILAADGIVQTEVQARVNEGGLMMKPRLDMRSDPPVLTIPDNSQVLDKMPITKDMANQLLARIHPLFMGASQMSGTVDLNLERFSWPLGKDSLNDLQFSGFMDLNEVRLDSSAMLGALLQVLRVKETSIDLNGQQIRFAAKDGRIATNPLRTNLSDTELVISGSMGLDTTIDYLAQVEVTERLVGGDLYNYLEGTMINVPIGGTLSQPDISAQTVQRAVKDLINQAGRKKLQDAAGNLLKQLF